MTGLRRGDKVSVTYTGTINYVDATVGGPLWAQVIADDNPTDPKHIHPLHDITRLAPVYRRGDVLTGGDPCPPVTTILRHSTGFAVRITSIGRYKVDAGAAGITHRWDSLDAAEELEILWVPGEQP